MVEVWADWRHKIGLVLLKGSTSPTRALRPRPRVPAHSVLAEYDGRVSDRVAEADSCVRNLHQKRSRFRRWQMYRK